MEIFDRGYGNLFLVKYIRCMSILSIISMCFLKITQAIITFIGMNQCAAVRVKVTLCVLKSSEYYLAIH